MHGDVLERLPAYLLAGGRSRRFGSDKARAEVAGTPLIVRLARQLQPLTSSVIVVASQADQYADLGLTTIADIHPGRGPLAGLHTALHHVDQPWLLLCSCDLLVCRPHWLNTLAAARTSTTRAVAFRDQHWHPFPGLYHHALAEEVTRRLMADDLRMQHLLDAEARPAALPVDWPAVSQANTPADLAHAKLDQA